MAPELFRFRKGSFSGMLLTVKLLVFAGKPLLEKLPYPPWLFITDPGAVWAI